MKVIIVLGVAAFCCLFMKLISEGEKNDGHGKN